MKDYLVTRLSTETILIRDVEDDEDPIEIAKLYYHHEWGLEHADYEVEEVDEADGL